MNRRRVLVTGVGGRSVGAGIVHALQRVQGGGAASRWEVVGADADPFAWGLYVAAHGVVLPRADDPSYVARVRDVVAGLDIVAVLPGTDAETRVLAADPEALAPAIVITNRNALMPLMADKSVLATRMEELGFTTPRTRPVAQWKALSAEVGFPLIFKPATASGGSRGVRIATSAETAERLVTESAGLGPMIVQECLPFEDDEFTVGVLTARDGSLIDTIVMQRRLQGLSLKELLTVNGRDYAISSGYSQGFIVDRPDIRAACEALACVLDSRGPLNIQLRAHRGRVFVFEVHPRFSGTTPIRAEVGFNEPDILLRNAIDGERFGRLGFRTGVVAIRALEHVVVPMAEYRAYGGSRPRQE